MKRGLIALDIDGTLTDGDHQIPQKVIDYLRKLYDDGWAIILLTGRMFSYAKSEVERLNFPFYLAIQNGADILEMPSQTRAEQAYFGQDVIDLLDHLYQNIESDFLIYSGYEKGDFCYYRSKNFPASMTSYLQKLESLSAAPWVDCENFQLEQQGFPLIKCVGLQDELVQIEQKLEGVTTSLIKDPISHGYYHLILVTHPEATKGKALRRIQKKLNITGPIIAAGDDTNDIPMFEEADISIAMETGPRKVLACASIIAKPSIELGIIPALQTALKQC